MECLLKKKKIYKSKVSRLLSYGDTHPEMQVADMSIQLEKVKGVEDEGEQLFLSIGELASDQEYDQYEEEFNEINLKLHNYKLKLIEQISKQDKESRLRISRAETSGTDLKLPKIELPIFSGSYDQWMTFRDLFEASIHNNQKLSGAQKLQYLKSSLRGEAARVVQSITITNDNYNEAWMLLKKRFHNVREIVTAHLDRLTSQPAVQSKMPQTLRSFVDTTNECVRAIHVHNVPIEHWDVILVYLVTKSLDTESRREWELAIKCEEFPSFQQLMEFLDLRAHALLIGTVTNTGSTQGKVGRNSSVHHGTVNHGACYFCGGGHSIYKCQEFLKLSISNRRAQIKAKKLCFNCLRQNHCATQCQASGCRKCKGLHNSFLHKEEEQVAAKVDTPVEQTGPSNEGNKTSNGVSTFVSHQMQSNYVLLSTALILVLGEDGMWHTARTLLDSASQSSFITQACLKKLGLKRQVAHITISSLGGYDHIIPRGSVKLVCQSKVAQTDSFTVQALVLSKISTLQPVRQLKEQKWAHLDNLVLADPMYHQPGPIDILLGADIYGSLLEGGVRKGPVHSPVAIQTTVGWILTGKTREPARSQTATYHSQVNVDAWVKQFWDLPPDDPKKYLSSEEMECERHFSSTHSRTPDGRYIVKLPFKENSVQLGASRGMAVQRFKHLETRLTAEPQFHQQYKAFIDEYISLGHMELVPNIDKQLPVNQVYYMPHHAVINLASTSTKLRVVFDASAKSNTGVSLNDNLMVGPKLQTDLIPLLLQFRMHAIAISADIKKMYCQVLIHGDDVNYLRIVWRDNPNKQILDYRLLTVTYGTASAPYQATKCLQQLAVDEQSSYPKASSVLLSDFYVDDLLTGANSIEEAIQLQRDLQMLLAKGGFDLCKWATSNQEVEMTIPPEKLEVIKACHLGENPSVKALGVRWSPSSDTLAFAGISNSITGMMTKRKLLSSIGKVYDPLGFLSPVTIRGKLLFQSVWKEGISWDQPLGQDIQSKWEQNYLDLKRCESVTIPRFATWTNSSTQELHAFSDASSVAYASAVYLRSVTEEGEIKVVLMMAKTRVAPLKIQTLPRLELCGAVLLVHLVDLVKEALKIPTERIYCYTDSTIVLAWLNSSPARWKPFIANRINDIQQKVSSTQWRHVKSEENSADCASRGILADMLLDHNLWWEGPQFLHQTITQEEFSQVAQPADEELDMEEKVTKECFHIIESCSMVNRYSSLSHLQRITAWIMRFSHNSRSQRTEHKIGTLTSDELRKAMTCWIKIVQREHFPEEIKKLYDKNLISTTSPILSLNPFLDPEGVIRVGGWLRNADIKFQQKHPPILPANHQLVSLIIKYEHERLLHAGPGLVQASIYQKFWILHLRSAVRKIIHHCVICQRFRGATNTQLMGNLPSGRVNPAKTFSHCGVDCGGPFLIKGQRRRNSDLAKAYICLFVCFTTKAIHLEVLTSLSTTAFIACLRCFTSQRGCPSNMYSDCGTNFTGADSTLRQWMKSWKKEPNNHTLAKSASERGINWHFNPPAAPHFGGLWEAGIKSFKRHFVRIVGKTTLSLEELITISTQIEACLNSRPLTALPTEPDDLEVLTPGHFLVGEALTAVPSPVSLDTPVNHLTRWELCQQMVKHFWKRWKAEYLHQLQQRTKWRRVTANAMIGQIVIIKDENLKPLHWKLGRIIQVHPGSDDLIRTVRLKTATGEILRPITKIAILPVDAQQEIVEPEFKVAGMNNI